MIYTILLGLDDLIYSPKFMWDKNESGILIPVSKDYHGTETDGIVVLKYMLSDRVLLENGFKTPKLKEERNV